MIDHFSVGAHRDLDIGTISVTGKICDNAALTSGYGADQVEYDKHSREMGPSRRGRGQQDDDHRLRARRAIRR